MRTKNVKKLDLGEIAEAVGGVVVKANKPYKADVRMLDTWHANKATAILKLPVVFTGTIDQVREWAKVNGYKEVHDRNSLFGVHYTDKSDNSYILT